MKRKTIIRLSAVLLLGLMNMFVGLGPTASAQQGCDPFGCLRRCEQNCYSVGSTCGFAACCGNTESGCWMLCSDAPGDQECPIQ